MSTGYNEARITTKLSDLVRSVAPKLPGCPPAAIRYQLVDTMIDFCRQTGAMVVTLGPYNFEEEVTTYPLDAPYLASVSVLHRVQANGMDMHKTSYKLISDVSGGMLVEFSFIPRLEHEQWTAEVSIIPQADIEDLPIAFVNTWGHAIVAGTLAELMMDDGKRYFNRNMAASNMQRYDLAKQDARYRRLFAQSDRGYLTFENPDAFVVF